MLPGSTIAEPGNIVTRLENFPNLVTSYQVTAYDQAKVIVFSNLKGHKLNSFSERYEITLQY